MAQPIYAIEYLGAISVEPKKQYTSSNIKTDYPTANMLKMKSNNILVSINNTDMFKVSFDDETYLPTNCTYMFSEKCTIAVGRYVAIQ